MDETRPAIHERDTERARLASALPAYEIGDILGRGAFAVVYAARHRHLEREVAIKRLSPELLREPEARGRFAAEARLLASLDHPHIVRVHDYVEEEDVCAFVMERMTGGTLADRMAAGVQREWACAVMLGALHGLEHAHRKGVLHRDIKPENLLFDAGSQVKVADFGIAKVVGAQGARLTATAAAIGTPAYMAPEQVTRNAGPLSSATDVWSAAAVLYEMLAGKPPFALEGELGAVLFERVSEDPTPLRDVAPDIPQELRDVVMGALARDPAERYPTPGTFAGALEPAADRAFAPGGLAATGVPIHRTPPRTDGVDAPVLLQTTEPAPAPRKTRRPRRGVIVAALGALLVAAIAAVVLVVASPGGDNQAAALPPAPNGWPKVESLGYTDQVEYQKGSARRLGAGGSYSNIYYGDAAAKKDWSHDPQQQDPREFILQTADAGLFPYIGLYSIRTLGMSKKGVDAEGPELRRILTSPRLMKIYWNNVKKFLKRVGGADEPAAVSLDSNFYSTLEKDLNASGERPSTVQARIALSGLPELKGLPNNLIGFAQAWQKLKTLYAPKALLGYMFDDWASAGVDISRDSPDATTVRDSARAAANFYLDVAANNLDFAALTVNGEQQEGENPSSQNVYSPSEKEALVEFIREFVRVADVPVVLEGVPLGNTASRAITDKNFHWHDSWVQWLIGNKDFGGLKKMRDAGVIGIQFGTGYGPDETCPCDAAKDKVTNGGPYGEKSTSPDDDGGYFASRVAALLRHGGLALGHE